MSIHVSRDTWSNRQILPWNTKWSRAKTNRVLLRECTGHSKNPLRTIQETTLHVNITKWSIPISDWSYTSQPKMEKLYTVSKNKTCGSDHDRLISSFRLKLNNIGKTTRPLRYDLNPCQWKWQIQSIRSGRDSAWTMDRGS